MPDVFKMCYNRKRNAKRKLHIGQRMLKTSAAVMLCFGIYILRGEQGIPFYSAIAAILCMQPYVENSSEAAKNRIIGTLAGAVYGSAVLCLYYYGIIDTGISYVVIALAIIPVIATMVHIGKPQVAYFACVVFLSITANHMTDEAPFIFVMNRVLDTLIGVVVSLLVNFMHIPRRKRNGILFVSGMDDTLLNKNGSLTPYSKVELNRMIADGANFTVSTMRTPASLMEPMKDIRLNLPVVAMDGAVLYDIKMNRYLKIHTLNKQTVRQLHELVKEEQIGCFYNTVIQDVLLIYLEEFQNIMMQNIYQDLKKNPYRNYLCAPLPEEARVVYLYLVDTEEKIQHFIERLKGCEAADKVRFRYGRDERCGGFSYLKIYDKDATREAMNEYLKQIAGAARIISFGEMKNAYDVSACGEDDNAVVRRMKEIYEPYFWKKG